MRRFIAIIMMPILAISFFGCSNEENGTTIQPRNDQNDIANLHQEVEALKAEIVKYNEMIEQLTQRIITIEENDQIHKEIQSDLENRLYMMDSLLKKMPGLSIKIGYLHKVYEENQKQYITFDPVQFLSGEDAILAVMQDENRSREDVSLPNGFYIRNPIAEEIKYELDSDADYYLIDGVYPQEKDFDTFKNDTASHDESLFHIYIINQKVVRIVEQYLP